MDLGLRDRTYLVTGASTGLGFASAAALVADGARVVICSRSQDKVDAAVAALEEVGGGGCAAGLALDLADADAAARLLALARERFGDVDGAILSVGGPPPGGVAEISDDAWRAAFETVFLGPLRVAVAVLNAGSDKAVTFVLSTSVKAPVAGLGISNGLRPGLAGAAKSLAEEYGARGGRVNMVLPGRIETDRTRSVEGQLPDPAAARAAYEKIIPLGRYAQPEELGKVAAFLTSPAASYVTGVALAVDGGMTRSL